MAESLDYQLRKAEEALAKNSDLIVREALQEKIAAIKKKIGAKGSRKCRLPDGTEVGVGDTVYVLGRTHYRCKDSQNYRGNSIFRLPSIGEKVVRAVSGDGGKIAFQLSAYGRQSYETPQGAGWHVYYGTLENALLAAITHAEKEVEKNERILEDAKVNVATISEDLEAVKTWAVAQAVAHGLDTLPDSPIAEKAVTV